MLAIYKKEMRSYFINPVGYVFVGVFLAMSAALCCYTTLQSNTYSTASYYYWLILSMIIIIPLLTMRTFSEERKMRTEQLLLTAPVSITGMVLGKYFAALALFASTILVSCINFFPLVSYAIVEESQASDAAVHIGPVGGQIVGCLIGMVLIGAAFIALGLFISSLTESQLSAAVITVAAIAVMLLVGLVNEFIGVAFFRTIINWISVLSRFDYFAYGFFDFSALLYYCSISGVFLFLTVRIYEKRRWG